MKDTLQAGIHAVAAVLVSTATARSTSWARRRACTPRRCWCATSRSRAATCCGRHLDRGEDSVGTRIELDHLAATLLGMTVELTVRVAARRRPRGDVRRRGPRRRGPDLPRAPPALRRRRREDARAARGQGAEGEGGVTMTAATTRRVPTYCYQCVAGPDLLTVKVVDGVATEVEPNFCAADVHPGGGKVCVKAFGLVQKTYNPHRVLTPMKRTNPNKGRGEDPGFVPISLGRGARSHRGAAQRRPRGRIDATRRAIRASPRASAAAARRSRTWARFPRSSPRGGRSTWASARARASSATTPSTCTASSGTARSSSRRTRRCATT